ncbi:DoxX family protein [Flavobacterium sp. 9AF]|uniref:BT_3928 family protein n=1 Tax=Flavobacterium sp. 9AF TaxID=2653142 RepID=UPI0012F3CA5F|nr:BT_3928 family protein [Flavobacterium sp. 9AF]VXB71226.1 DoxX family protein [Flavobacterium sp. 9AF]
MNFKNIVTQIARILVGVLFIISGLIKLNDPLGFSYKLEEYFSANVLNMEFLVPAALIISCFIVIFEVVLGVMLLIGFKTKFTVWSLLLMIVFFTFLTFYSWYFDKVKDCGCFGDALKLTPFESFIKDLILLFLILILFFNQNYIKPLYGKSALNLSVFAAYSLCLFMAYYVLQHLPIIDFRAYKIGNNIQKGMEIPDGAPKSEYEMVFIYKVNGVNTEIPYNDVMNNKIPEGAEFVDRKDKLIKEGYVPPIHDFTIEKDGSNYVETILQEPKVVLLIAYDLNKSKEKGMKKLEDFNQRAVKNGYQVIGLTASDETLISETKKKFNLSYDFYFCDPTTLKTIVRANPGIVILEKGTIVQKVHFNDLEKVVLN